MRKLLLILIIAFTITVPNYSQAKKVKNGTIKNAVVKVFATSSAPNYFQPWKLKNFRKMIGSGAVIEGNRIITNAHVVSNNKLLEVQAFGNPDKFKASVLYISHDADLAIITVEDKSFFKNIKPLKFGPLPETLQEVMVYGYPTGGNELSITKGILSRIVYQSYSHSGMNLLSGQIDAAINPGNSGGPVMVGNKIVGISMQKYSSSNIDNIGYIIPTLIINHFLNSLKDKNRTEADHSFPSVPFSVQSMENPDFREKMKMSDDETGVLVFDIIYNSDAANHIKIGDVLLEVDGHHIANNGTVELRPQERLSFGHFIKMHRVGEKIDFKILRDGVATDISFKVDQIKEETSLIAPMAYNKKPRFFVYGGIVFTALTRNLLCEWNGCRAPSNLTKETTKLPSEDLQELVIAIQVLPHSSNKGYHNNGGWVVNTVNDKNFKNLDEFYELVKNNREKYLTLKNDFGKSMVISTESAEKNHSEILKLYRITKDLNLEN